MSPNPQLLERDETSPEASKPGNLSGEERKKTRKGEGEVRSERGGREKGERTGKAHQFEGSANMSSKEEAGFTGGCNEGSRESKRQLECYLFDASLLFPASSPSFPSKERSQARLTKVHWLTDKSEIPFNWLSNADRSTGARGPFFCFARGLPARLGAAEIPPETLPAVKEMAWRRDRKNRVW